MRTRSKWFYYGRERWWVWNMTDDDDRLTPLGWIALALAVPLLVWTIATL
jgi:hypothetical protein